MYTAKLFDATWVGGSRFFERSFAAANAEEVTHFIEAAFGGRNITVKQRRHNHEVVIVSMAAGPIQ